MDVLGALIVLVMLESFFWSNGFDIEVRGRLMRPVTKVLTLSAGGAAHTCLLISAKSKSDTRISQKNKQTCN